MADRISFSVLIVPPVAAVAAVVTTPAVAANATASERYFDSIPN